MHIRLHDGLLSHRRIQTDSYRLIEFENKFQERLQAMRNHAIFTAENDDNERHVLRTMGERIELRQPVNVSRLYPSLPDLREEIIDQENRV